MEERKAMRDAFVQALLAHAHADKRIMLVTGDLGFGVLTAFSQELPEQFINAGVAEQNMMGLSAGLAIEGRNVFTYSIANFPTIRCLEQIRNDVCYHGISVNVVAIGGGFSYGSLGMSHHATEDIAIMRSLPGLRVFAPCDELETVALLQQMVDDPAPTYLRLDKSKVTDDQGEPFFAEDLRQLRQGEDVAIVGYGGILGEAIAASEFLELEGIYCSVYSAHTLKPFNGKTLIQLAQNYNAILTLEEHVPTGGLGSIAADIFVEAGTMPNRFSRMCLPDSYSAIVGSQDYLRMRHGLDVAGIVARVRHLTAT
jgi:transketolase